LAAVRSALDNTGKVILKDHLRHCVADAVQEAMKMPLIISAQPLTSL
jgi:DNA-binding FrmR family transcriptional regulator